MIRENKRAPPRRETREKWAAGMEHWRGGPREDLRGPAPHWDWGGQKIVFTAFVVSLILDYFVRGVCVMEKSAVSSKDRAQKGKRERKREERMSLGYMSLLSSRLNNSISDVSQLPTPSMQDRQLQSSVDTFSTSSDSPTKQTLQLASCNSSP